MLWIQESSSGTTFQVFDSVPGAARTFSAVGRYRNTMILVKGDQVKVLAKPRDVIQGENAFGGPTIATVYDAFAYWNTSHWKTQYPIRAEANYRVWKEGQIPAS